MRLWLLVLSLRFSASYHTGDVVPASRRAQFHGQRTQWHDLLGRHCPRFGHSKTVAIPLPQPVGFLPGDDYKLALSFEGDRLHTPWLTLLGNSALEVPLVEVTLVRLLPSCSAVLVQVCRAAHPPAWKQAFTGGVVRAVRAQTVPMPASFLQLHQELVAEFNNATVWPKHALVLYQWREEARVDVAAGLIIVLVMGASHPPPWMPRLLQC